MKTIKFILYLTILIYAGRAAYNAFAPQTIEFTQHKAVVEVSADSIRAICQINGASQRVKVLFDTSFVSQTPDLVVFGVSVLTRDQVQRYSEQRVWDIKAGTSEVSIVEEGNKTVIQLNYPKVLTSQEIESDFKILYNTTDNWSAAHAHKHVSQSRRLAEAKAIRAGIAHRAAVSIEDALRSFIPNSITIKWVKNG